MDMLKRIIWVGLALACADPILLYYIYEATNGWVVLGILLPFPLLVSWLAGYLRREEESVGGLMLSFIARLLLWYPGPVSKLLAVLLLLPPVRRLLMRWALIKVKDAVDTGAVSYTGYYSSGGVPSGRGSRAPFAGDGSLKQADGRVIHDQPELPPPEQKSS
jgi:hypothetical protein